MTETFRTIQLLLTISMSSQIHYAKKLVRISLRNHSMNFPTTKSILGLKNEPLTIILPRLRLEALIVLLRINISNTSINGQNQLCPPYGGEPVLRQSQNTQTRSGAKYKNSSRIDDHAAKGKNFVTLSSIPIA